jgi:RHS repeat-associated protein
VRTNLHTHCSGLYSRSTLTHYRPVRPFDPRAHRTKNLITHPVERWGGGRALIYGPAALVWASVLFLSHAAWAQTCSLYPVALSAQQLSNAAPGVVLSNIFNGTQPGNFGWLSWGGSPSEPTLVTSLTPPGDSSTYVNPDNPSDHLLHIGDWVGSKPGVSNSKNVRDALNVLETMDITVPVWDQARGSGATAAYRISGFARVRLLSYQLPQQNRITARFLGMASCGVANLAPVVNPGPPQTITLPASAALDGVITDDGLPAGGTLTARWSEVSGPGSVTFTTLALTNTLNGTPVTNHLTTTATFSVAGTYVLQLSASDSQLSSSNDVVITVNRQDSAPTADFQSVTLNENTSTNITLHGSDPDGDTLSYIVVTLPNYGTLSGTPPNLIYTPKPDFSGQDSFTFKVNDGLLDSPVATVSITIAHVNVPPVADPQTVTNLENTSSAIVLSGSDVEGSPLTYHIISGPTNGTLTGTAPYVTYLPATNFFGNDAFIFTVNDGLTDSIPAVVTIIVQPVDQPPIVVAGPDQLIILPTNTVQLAGTVTYSAFPGTVDSVQWSEVSGPAPITFANASATATTATFSQSGIYTLRLTASDSFLTGSNDLVVTVDAPPVVSAGPAQTNTLPGTVTLYGYASDDGLPTNGTLTVSWSKISGPGTVVFSAPNATNTTASFSQSGIYVLQLAANDGIAPASDQVTVLMNEAPIVDAGSAQVLTNFQAVLNGTVFDDGLPTTNLLINWSQVSGPGTASFANSNSPTTTVTFDQSGIYVLRLSANDSLVVSSKDVTNTVDGAPVVAASGDSLVTLPASANLTATASDDGLPTGSTLTYGWTVVSGPGTVTFSNPSALNTTASFSASGVYVVQFAATDSLLVSSTNLTIIANQAPVVSAGPAQLVTVPQSATLHGSVSDDGLPNGVLTAAWSKLSGPGTVAFGDAAAPVTTASFSVSGIYVLQLTGSDGVSSNSDTVTITVNHAPVVDAGPNQTISWPSNQVSLNGTATDDGLPTGSTLVITWSKVSGPGQVTFGNAAAAATTATFSSSGLYVLRLAASDGVSSTSATVTITVNHPPLVDAGLSQTILWPSNQVALNGTATDDGLPIGSTLSITWSELSGPASVTFADAHAPSTTATFSTNGAYVLQLTASDGISSSSATVTITVDQGPMVFVTTPGAITWPSNQVVLSGTVIDDGSPAGGTLSGSWSQVSGPGTVSFALPTFTNALQGTAITNSPSTAATFSAPGLYVVRLTADDGLGTNHADVTVTVNQAPMVSAGPNQTILWPNNQVVLNGTATDDGLPTGSTLSVTWSELSGPAPVTFADAHATNTTATFSASGAYVLQLSASDGISSSSATVTITVDQGPMVLLTTPGVITWPNNQVVLNGTVTDDGLPAGGILSGSWSQVSGPGSVTFSPATFTNGLNGTAITNQASTTATFSASGLYVVRLTADDGLGTNHADVTVTVNHAPIVSAGTPQRIPFGQVASLNGAASDDGLPVGSTLVVAWSKVSGPGTVSFGNPAAAVTTAWFDAPGVYVLQLTASDGISSSSDAVTITVDQGSAVAIATPPVITWPSNTVLLLGTVSDDGLPASGILHQVWSQVSGPGTVSFATPTQDDPLTGSPLTNQFSTTATFSAPGLYVVRLTADDGLVTNYANALVTVNQAPVVTAGPNQLILWPSNHVAVTATVSDDGLPVSGNLHQAWTQVSGPGTVTFAPPTRDDGLSGSAVNNSLSTVATFSASGLYVVRLTADDGLATNHSDITVTVDQAPVVSAGPNQIILWPSNQVALNGTATDDGLPTGSTVSINWSQVSGPTPVAFADAHAPNTTATFPTNGAYVLRLSASDGFASNSATVAITVDMAPAVTVTTPPVIGWPTNQVALSGTVTDDGLPIGNILNQLWSQVSGPGTLTFAVPRVTNALTGASISHPVATTATFTAPGLYVVRLTADDGFATNSATVTLTVDQAPVALPQTLTVLERQPLPIVLQGTSLLGNPLIFTVVTNPAFGNLTGTAPNLTYTPSSNFFGADAFSFVASDGLLTSVPAPVTITITPLPRSRTWTLNADFLQGQLSQVAATNDELMLGSRIEAFNNLWVAVSTKGTIVRIDTETGEIKGEYKSAPDGEPLNPSRTTVDLDGSIWAANRNGNSIVHIAVPESGLWKDRNTNGVLDTSTGLGDVRPWPNPNGVDSGGGASSAQDELILNYVKVSSFGTRHVAVDSSNNVWVSGTSSRTWDYVEGATGHILRHENSVGYGGYGGLIDRSNVIWSSNPLLRWDTSKPLTGPNGGNWKGYSNPSYGIGLDSQGNVWVSQLGSGQIMKLAPDGTILGQFNQGNPNAQGVAVDLNDDVWVAHSLLGGTTVGHLKNDGTFVGNVKVGNGPTGVAVDSRGKIWVANYYSGNVMRIDPNLGPTGADGVTPLGQVDYISPYLGGNLYNYSDMTGSTLTGVPGKGTWIAIYDSTIPHAQWGPAAWNAKIYDDGQLQVAFATSDDGVHFGPDETLATPNAVPASVGRYARLKLTFVRASSGKGPVLDDITIGTAGYNAPVIQPTLNIDAGPDLQLQLPLAELLQASIWHNGFLHYDTNQLFSWSEVSGPGSVTFGTPTAATTTARFSTQGVYVVSVQATLLGTTYSDSVQITAIPVNRSPWVDVGSNRALRSTNDVLHIEPTATDDGLPAGSTLTVSWSKIIGPGTVTFSNPNVATNDIRFSAPGIYILQLSASDSQLTYAAQLEVRVQAVCQVNAPEGLAMWWPGNSQPNEIVRGNSMSLFGAAGYTNAQISYGFNFNGAVTNYAKAYDHPAMDIGSSDSMTIEFWAEATASGRFLDWYRAGTYGVYADFSTSGNTLTFHLIDTNGLDHQFSVGSALSSSQFQHFALTYDKNKGLATAFVNGIVSSVVSLGSFTPRTTGDLYLSGGPQDATHFAGIIDELSLYNRALNGEEIYNIFTASFIGKCPVDNNQPPVVSAGNPISLPAAGSAVLNGSVTDDGLPVGSTIYSEWRSLAGPTNVIFANSNSPTTTATFPLPGLYVLQLYADDSVKSATDQVGPRIGAVCSVKNIPGLVTWWPGNNSTADVFGNGSLIRVNGAGYASGEVGAAFNFNGANNYLWTPAQPAFDIGQSTNGFTVEFWMNPNSFQNGSLLGWANGVRVERFSAGYASGDSLHFYVAGTASGQYINSTPIWTGTGALNQWYHIGLTFDRTSGLAKIYVNGVLNAAGNVGTSLLSTATDFYLGQVPSSAGFFSGQLDEISLYSRPLNPQEVYQIYASGAAGKCPFDNNAAPVVYAGPDLFVRGIPGVATLDGDVTDDGLPAGSTLSIQWSKFSGPGAVTFNSPTSAVTTATFSTNGIYVLQLTASDGEVQSSDLVEVRVEALCTVDDPNGLAAWWPGNGTSLDVMGGQSAILGSGANYVPGKVASAFNFDGSAKYVWMPAQANYNVGASTNGFTVEFWMNPNSFQNGSLLGWANALRVERFSAGYASGDSLHFFVGGTASGQYINSTAIWTGSGVLNAWYHIGLTYDRTSGLAKIYVNGVLNAAGNVGTNLLSTATDFYLGQVPGSAGFFSGQLDEISLYQRPLNPQEVYNIYSSGSIGKCPNNNDAGPVVSAGPDLFLRGVPGSGLLQGSASGSNLRLQWSKFSGPGNVSFNSSTSAVTTASFSTNGIYVLQLTADDGEVQSSALTEVRVETICTVDDPAGLSAWWPANGTSLDVMGGQSGLLGSGTTFVPGKVASAFNFDGVANYVWMLAQANYNVGASTNGFTVEFWMNPNSFQNGSLLGWANALRVERFSAGYASGDSLHFFVGGTASGQYINSTAIWTGSGVLNAWYHIGLTYDRTSGLAKIYVNGVLNAAGNVGTNLLSTATDFYLGQVPGSAGFFSGQLDEISLYQRPLNPQEVYNIYSSGSIGKCPNDQNTPPFVFAGPDLFIEGVPGTGALNGQVLDDGLPVGSTLRIQWSKLSGPGTVTFNSPTSAVTTATFSAHGIYVLQLTANDGEAQSSDLVEVRVETLCNASDPAGLSAWWPGNGTSLDVMGGQAAILGSGAGYALGRVASAFNFNGVANYVWMLAQTNYNVGASTNGFTVEFWMNPNSFQDGSLLGWANALHVERFSAGYASGDSLHFFVAGTGSGQYINSTAIWTGTGALNAWYHIGLTYDRTSGLARIYVNGVLNAAGNVGTNLLSTATDFYLGQVPGSAGFFSGQLDEISLYQRPLNPQEVYNIYSSGSVGKCPNDNNNKPPVVFAGPSLTLASITNTATLLGVATDDGLPVGSVLRINWSKYIGPGTVTFGNPALPLTTATFSSNGLYVLQLSANDGEFQSASLVEARVGIPCAVLDPAGLSAWWPGNGTSLDVMGGQAAILGSGTTFVPGEVASAFNFDGAANYVWMLAQSNYNVGASTNGFTVEFWMNPNSFQDGSLLGWANALRVERFSAGYASGDSLHFFVAGTGSGQYINSTAIWTGTGALNAWYHIGLTYDRTSGLARIYVNGVLNAAGNVGTNLLSTATDFYLGQVPSSAGFFSGQLDEISLYTRPLAQSEIQAIFNTGTSGKCITPKNQAPTVLAGGNQTIYFPTNTITLHGAAYDDGLPSNTLQVAWSYVNGPYTIFFSSTNTAVTTVTFTNTGIYTFQLAASDGQYTSTDTATITVLPDPRIPPFVAVTAPVNGTSFVVPVNGAANINLAATASDLDGPITNVIFFVNGVALGATATPPYTLVASNLPPGNFAFTAAAAALNGLSTTSAPINISVFVDNVPPTVAMTGPTNTAFEVLTNGTTNFILSASASDFYGHITQVAFLQNGVNIGVVTNAPYNLPLANVPVGVYAYSAVASDNFGLSSTSAPVTVTVFVDPGPPIVAITAPADGGTITAPTNIIGTASSLILQSYQLQFRLETPDDTNAWNTLATGSSSVVNGALGPFDPTMLLNGIYELRLIATDLKGRTASTDTSTFIVDRNLKVGNFTISFNDLAIPVPGTPLQVIRTYDSRAAAAGVQGDFGLGWTLNIRGVRLQKNRPLGRNWEETTSGDPFGLSLGYHLDPGQPRIVTITFPDGTVQKFAFEPNPMDQPLLPIENPQWHFTPMGNTRGTLVPASIDEEDGSFLIVDGSIPGPVNLYDLNFFSGNALANEQTLEQYPTLFRYTSAEGYRYIIDEIAGLQSVTDPNNNTLLISTNGLTWTNSVAGTNNVNIAFQRDAQGRITNIVDALGNSLRYAYGTNGDLVAFTDRLGNTNGFAYTNTAFPHYLTSIIDARGISPVHNQYDASGRLVGTIDAFGSAIAFGHDLANNREYITNRLGQVTVSQYDQFGNVIHQIDANGGETFSQYDVNGNLLSRADPLGRTNTYAYDDQDNRLTTTDALGHVTRFTYGAMRRVTSITDPLGHTITNTYDVNGNLLSRRDPLGNVTAFSYDPNGLPVSLTNALGQAGSFVFDAQGHLLAETDPTGHATTYVRDANGNALQRTSTRTTPRGLETDTVQYFYDAENHLTNSVFPDGSTVQAIYNGIGKPAITTDQLGRQTSVEYDALGRMSRTVYPDGSSESRGYDLEGRHTSTTNALGQVTRYQYDALGRLTSTFYADGSSTSNTFDPAGQILVFTDERGASTSYGYDLGGRSIVVSNALGQVTHKFYDAAGNLTNSVDPAGRSTAFVYDALNRKIQTLLADGTSQITSYDAIGRRTAETDAATNTTAFGYDSLGRLTSVTNALGLITTYTYDELGHQIGQTDANNHTTTFEYDPLGRRTKRTLPGGQSESYTYSLSGFVASKTDFNGYTTTYQYDLMDRLLEKVPDSRRGEATVSFGYNALGMRTNMVDAVGTTLYSYDARNRLVQKTRTWSASVHAPALTETLSYAYDANGNLTNIASANANGASVAYEFDSLNRLVTVNDPKVGRSVYGYDAVGNLQQCIYANLVTSIYEYDSLNRLTNLASDKLLTPIAAYAYSVGPTGNRVAASETLFATALNSNLSTIDRVYSYDSVYRLTSEAINLNSQHSVLNYSYDNVGNRITRTSTVAPLQSQSFGYDPDDRLISDHYDANGNTTAGLVSFIGSQVTDAYDFENRLIDQNNGQIRIAYDGDGNRIRKTVASATNTVTTYYLVGDVNPTGYAQVLEDFVSLNDVPPTLSRSYTYGHMLISQDQIEGTTWVVSFSGYDGHNNVRYLTDVRGIVTDSYDYDAFGNIIARTGSTPNTRLFSGEEFDNDLGFYYLRARYENTDTARFWNQDSYEGETSDPPSLHKYTYCANNPVNCFDPSGKGTLAEINVAIGIAGSVMNFWQAGQKFIRHDYSGAAVSAGFGVLGLFGGFIGGAGLFPPGGAALAGGGELLAAASSTGVQLLGTAAGVLSLGGALLNIRDLTWLWTFNMNSSGSSPWMRSPSGGPPDPLQTAGMRKKIFDILQEKLADKLAALRQIDPDLEMGLRGSTISGTSSVTGAPWDPQAFDLDIYIKSDKLVGSGDYFPVSDLFRTLQRELPELFGGLRDGGVSVKTFRQSSNLGPDAVAF